VSITWDLPVLSHRNGVISGFKACIKLKSNDQIVECREFGVGVKSYTFSSLTPFTEYVITVAAKNAQGYGPAGSGVQKQTLEGTPSAPTLVSTVTQKDTTSCLITPPSQPKGNIIRYEVKVSRARNGVCSMQGGSVGRYSSHSNLITVNHVTLLPNVSYCFWVRAVNRRHSGEWSAVVMARIVPVMGGCSVTPETPTEATACIDTTQPPAPAVLKEINVYYSPCQYDPANPVPEGSATFSANLRCQRLTGLRPGICYQFSFSVKIVINGLTLPMCRTPAKRIHLPSLDSAFNLPPRGFLKSMSVCSVYGSHHVTTFDGQPFTVNNMGRYVIVRDRKDFSLTADLKSCGGSNMQCLDNIVFTDLDCNLQVKMTASDCGGSIDISYGMCDHGDVLSWIQGCKRHVVLRRSNLEITWDGSHYLIVDAGDRLQGELCGLCGDYNGDRGDDLVVSNRWDSCDRNTTEEEMQCRIDGFADRWRRREATSEEQEQHKQCSWKVSPIATQTCEVLMDSSGPFSKCFPVINFATFHRQCISDACGEEEDVRQARFCALAAEYVARCSKCGVNLVLPEQCAPKKSLDCILKEHVIPGFYFGSINDASPHYCATQVKQRRCMSQSLDSSLCKPTRSSILDVGYSCQPISEGGRPNQGRSKDDKTITTTLKVPEDFSCDIYT
jgi:hypothetical protein